jgi:hypothetical protein
LEPGCPGKELCIASGDHFICVLDASGEEGFYGDPWEYANACKSGLSCLNPECVEGCQAAGCCTPFCDTTKPLMCPGATQECIPWYEEGMAPPRHEDVGICAAPGGGGAPRPRALKISPLMAPSRAGTMDGGGVSR